MSILPPEVQNSEIWQTKCYIDGQWIDSKNTLSVTNPLNDELLAEIPVVSSAQVEQAIDAAQQAQKSWCALMPAERRQVLHAWKELLHTHVDTLAKIITLEQGKPLFEAKGEILYTASYLDFYGDEAIRIYGEILPSPFPDSQVLIKKEPVGVVGIIAPWNFPAAMFMRKVAMALSAGCTCVIKPDEKTPLTAFALMNLAQMAGVPAGVVNCVTGNPQAIGEQLCASEKVRKISFTGSTEVGKLLMRQSAETVKKITLELGGNAPFIVFDDADVDAAVQGLMLAKFRNAGQTCVCANRVFVQNGVYDAFKEALIKALQKLKLGNGLEEGVEVGPIIDQAARDRMRAYLSASVEMGAKITCGGELQENFFQPTLVENITPGMPVMINEVFGPVLSLMGFETDEEVILAANDTPFGLASYFYAKDIKRIHNVMDRLEYGIVGVNTGMISAATIPFGGVKQSGFGREGSKFGLEDYLTLKYICIQN